MHLKTVEVAQRVDNKFNIWASVNYSELFKVKREIPIKVRQWVVIQVCNTLPDADKFLESIGVRNYKILPTKYH